MNTISMPSYRPSQKLHPLSLLAQLTSRQTNGCLQVSSRSATWSLFLEQGKLIYATNSVDPFERLDRHLRRLSSQIPTLVSATRVQVRVLFENLPEADYIQNRDYQAIIWLVEQQYLTPGQAATLIEELAREVIESFLAIREGSYELISQSKLGEFPKFCQLDLRPLVEYCQNQLRLRQSSGNQPVSTLQSSLFLNRNPEEVPKTHLKSNSTISTGEPTLIQPPEAQTKHTYTIACIDDSQTVLQAIKSFLDDKSFTVLMINDPVKALMQIIRNKPDLILLDVEMPNLDGYELCSLLRKHSNFKNTPIIMVTGHTGFVDRAKAKLVRASGYLTKPFTQSDLLKMIFKHLN
jgi:twitching motility two-component system response regulator PilG